MDRSRPPAAVTGRHHGTKIPELFSPGAKAEKTTDSTFQGYAPPPPDVCRQRRSMLLLNLFATPAAAETLDFSTRYSAFC
jgi:hypothetical protein